MGIYSFSISGQTILPGLDSWNPAHILAILSIPELNQYLPYRSGIVLFLLIFNIIELLLFEQVKFCVKNSRYRYKEK